MKINDYGLNQLGNTSFNFRNMHSFCYEKNDYLHFYEYYKNNNVEIGFITGFYNLYDAYDNIRLYVIINNDNNYIYRVDKYCIDYVISIERNIQLEKLLK